MKEFINKDLKLSDREWVCPKCGDVVSRDKNAAINIKSFALKNILSGTDRKNQGKLPTLVGALTLEAQLFGLSGGHVRHFNAQLLVEQPLRRTLLAAVGLITRTSLATEIIGQRLHHHL